MGKATLVLVTLASLGFGLLVGFSLVDDEGEDAGVESIDTGLLISTGGAPAFRYISPNDAGVLSHNAESGDPFANGENFIAYDSEWKSEVLEIALPADGRVEYKAFMSKGGSLVFNWKVKGEEVYYDLHAHDEAFGDDFYTRYDDGRGIERSGMIAAAFDGQHGWYWQNLEPDDVTLTLAVAGYYEKIVEMDLTDE